MRLTTKPGLTGTLTQQTAPFGTWIDRYITSEVAPFVDRHCNNLGQKILTTGVSMGGYHSANFFFRHPDIFDTVIAISGIYGLQMFLGDYSDENVYLNSPLPF